ncbi:MAG: hypothetical protein ABSD90_09605, partial [Methylocystis sp.]
RFAVILADANARLGANADCYSFIAVDLHHLLFAGFYRRTEIQNKCTMPRLDILGHMRLTTIKIAGHLDELRQFLHCNRADTSRTAIPYMDTPCENARCLAWHSKLLIWFLNFGTVAVNFFTKGVHTPTLVGGFIAFYGAVAVLVAVIRTA